MFTERFIDTGEVRIRVAADPDDGPPILFLHGVTRFGRDFAPLFPAFADSWQLLALDHRGHGASGRASGAYHVVDYVRDAVAVVQSLTKPAILFGHSLGAVTAAAVAAAEPDRVRAVILEDPPSAVFIGKLKGTAYHAQFTEVRKLAGQNRPIVDLARDLANIALPQPNGTTVLLGDVRDATMLRFSAKCLPDVDPGVLDAVLDGTWFNGYDEHAIWSAIQCPVLLLRGEELRGGMLPAACADRMAKTIRDCSRVDVAGVGHLIHWLATERCVQLVLGFLESI